MFKKDCDLSFSFIPFIASLITPITAFVATVYVTANLSIRSEIIALLSSGFSLKRIMLPYTYGGILIAIMSFVLNGWILPKANKSRVNFEVSYIKSPYYFSDNNVHFKISDETYLYLERYDNNLEVGNNVSIGGQAGVSGHLNIGNNVRIGGGSGVVKDIPDHTTVMGYPAVPLKYFLKKK